MFTEISVCIYSGFRRCERFSLQNEKWMCNFHVPWELSRDFCFTVLHLSRFWLVGNKITEKLCSRALKSETCHGNEVVGISVSHKNQLFYVFDVRWRVRLQDTGTLFLSYGIRRVPKTRCLFFFSLKHGSWTSSSWVLFAPPCCWCEQRSCPSRDKLTGATFTSSLMSFKYGFNMQWHQ